MIKPVAPIREYESKFICYIDSLFFNESTNFCFRDQSVKISDIFKLYPNGILKYEYEHPFRYRYQIYDDVPKESDESFNSRYHEYLKELVIYDAVQELEEFEEYKRLKLKYEG